MSIKYTKTKGIEPLIIETICLRLKEKESLAYLEDRGYKISRAEYYKLKQECKNSSHKRLNHIASSEFLTQHIERIDNLKAIENELWNNYYIEKSPINRSKILMNIAEMQTYLSSYYDSTQFVMQSAARIRQSKEVNNRN